MNDVWGVAGITDAPRAPVVAKAKIGKQVERNGVVRPERLDHIIFVEPKTGRELPEFQVFGEKPKYFDALLIGNTVRECVDVAWKRFGTKGLKCRGNGTVGYDRETGAELQCAGPYNFEDPSQHKCPHARPSKKNGKDYPPECKPILSMRLLVPQVPGLGVVQIDTGGVASSIQTLLWQLRLIEQKTGGRMFGIAVRVGIRPFPDRFGNTAWSWQLTPLTAEEADRLRSGVESFQRIEAQMPSVPPMEELPPEADLYGLPPGGVDEEPKTVPAEYEDVVTEKMNRLAQLLNGSSLPKAKQEIVWETAQDNLQKAIERGTMEKFLEWLDKNTAALLGET